MRVLMAGSSGFLGSALRRHLAAGGHEVVPLVRRPAEDGERSWDPSEGMLDPAVFDGIDVVVNLCGVGIGDRRLTRTRMRAVTESRVGPTTLLAASMAGRSDRPGAFVSQSGVHYYGDTGDDLVTETAGPGAGFLADVVQMWEEAARPAAAAGVRTVIPRTSLVLSKEGGMLPRLLLPFRLGLGGRFMSGRQWWPWVTLHDWVRAVDHLLVGELEGPVIVASPRAVTNAEFVAALGRALHRPAAIPLPRWAITLGLGEERAEVLVSASVKAFPERLTESGFTFVHPDIDSALAAVL